LEGLVWVAHVAGPNQGQRRLEVEGSQVRKVGARVFNPAQTEQQRQQLVGFLCGQFAKLAEDY
jgi:hypothetical protein